MAGHCATRRGKPGGGQPAKRGGGVPVDCVLTHTIQCRAPPNHNHTHSQLAAKDRKKKKKADDDSDSDASYASGDDDEGDGGDGGEIEVG